MKSILVVEDEPGLAELVCTVLEDAGLSVLCVESGEAALIAAQNLGFKLAVIDIHLPGLGGLETMRRLKQLHPRLKIILMSGAPIENAEADATYFKGQQPIKELVDMISRLAA
jgi:CheY-like chemotaxis protein